MNKVYKNAIKKKEDVKNKSETMMMKMMKKTYTDEGKELNKKKKKERVYGVCVFIFLYFFCGY